VLSKKVQFHGIKIKVKILQFVPNVENARRICLVNVNIADGDYWHSLSKNMGRDRTKNAYLIKCGYNMLRLSETEINNGSFKNRLKEVLN
jgi:very-short-patch-repair endonuclease